MEELESLDTPQAREYNQFNRSGCQSETLELLFGVGSFAITTEWMISPLPLQKR